MIALTLLLIALVGVLCALSNKDDGPEPLTTRPRLGVTDTSADWCDDVDFDWPAR